MCCLHFVVNVCGFVILGQLQWFSARWRRTQAPSPKLVYFEKERIPLRSATLQIAPGFFKHWNAGVCRLRLIAHVWFQKIPNTIQSCKIFSISYLSFLTMRSFHFMISIIFSSQNFFNHSSGSRWKFHRQKECAQNNYNFSEVLQLSVLFTYSAVTILSTATSKWMSFKQICLVWTWFLILVNKFFPPFFAFSCLLLTLWLRSANMPQFIPFMIGNCSK